MMEGDRVSIFVTSLFVLFFYSLSCIVLINTSAERLCRIGGSIADAVAAAARRQTGQQWGRRRRRGGCKSIFFLYFFYSLLFLIRVLFLFSSSHFQFEHDDCKHRYT